MRLPTVIIIIASTTTAIVLPRVATPPQPSLTNISYWGSACPENGLSFTLGTTNATSSNGTSNTAPLSFTLSNFLPNFGNFGSSLRMCNAVTFLRVEKGWRVRVNEKGTTAKGDVQLPGNATMYFRATYMFAEPPFDQSIGMLDVPGPLTGPFSELLTPAEGNERGVEGGCEGEETELDIEFQARAVNDTYGQSTEGMTGMVADAKWTLMTDVEVVRCT